MWCVAFIFSSAFSIVNGWFKIFLKLNCFRAIYYDAFYIVLASLVIHTHIHAGFFLSLVFSLLAKSDVVQFLPRSHVFFIVRAVISLNIWSIFIDVAVDESLSYECLHTNGGGSGILPIKLNAAGWKRFCLNDFPSGVKCLQFNRIIYFQSIIGILTKFRNSSFFFPFPFSEYRVWVLVRLVCC